MSIIGVGSKFTNGKEVESTEGSQAKANLAESNAKNASVSEIYIPSGFGTKYYKLAEVTTNIDTYGNGVMFQAHGLSTFGINKMGVEIVELSTRGAISMRVHTLVSYSARAVSFGYVSNTTTGKTELWAKTIDYNYPVRLQVGMAFGATFFPVSPVTTEPTGFISATYTSPSESVEGAQAKANAAETNAKNASVPTGRTVTAGNGITGGGALSGNITLTLGTPGSLSPTSTNTATATGHTHDIATATQAEAEAGTSAAKFMTPERVKQAIAKLSPPPTATTVTIADTGNYFAGTNTEAALQEIGQVLNGTKGSLIDAVNTLLKA